MNMIEFENTLMVLPGDEFSRRWNEAINKSEAMGKLLTNENAAELIPRINEQGRIIEAYVNACGRRMAAIKSAARGV